MPFLYVLCVHCPGCWVTHTWAIFGASPSLPISGGGVHPTPCITILSFTTLDSCSLTRAERRRSHSSLTTSYWPRNIILSPGSENPNKWGLEWRRVFMWGTNILQCPSQVVVPGKQHSQYPKGVITGWVDILIVIWRQQFGKQFRRYIKIPFATARMELESIMLSEISQTVRDKYHMISPLPGT